MPWSNARPNGGKTAAKYRSKEHTQARAQHMAALKRAGSGLCAEVRCLYRSRLITPDMDLHLCHDRATGRVLGLGHRRCNVTEASRYARAKQSASRLRW
jgi:hypothetical protein